MNLMSRNSMVKTKRRRLLSSQVHKESTPEGTTNHATKTTTTTEAGGIGLISRKILEWEPLGKLNSSLMVIHTGERAKSTTPLSSPTRIWEPQCGTTRASSWTATSADLPKCSKKKEWTAWSLTNLTPRTANRFVVRRLRQTESLLRAIWSCSTRRAWCIAAVSTTRITHSDSSQHSRASSALISEETWKHQWNHF